MDLSKYIVQCSHKNRKIPKSILACLGGLSGVIATTLLHPLDLVKIRLQTHFSRRSTWLMFRNICKCEGPRGLYNGLSAGIMRQASSTTTRHAAYYWLHENYVKNVGKLTLKDKILITSFASMAGALAGTPSEVILIRMCAYGPLDRCNEVWQPLYHGLRHALLKIVRTEGVRGLWRGGTLTTVRAVWVGLIHFAGQKQSNVCEELWFESVHNIFTATYTGLVAAVLTLPIDMVKTRFQVSSGPTTMKDVFLFQLRTVGVKNFWRGFPIYFIRLAVHTLTTNVMLQEARLNLCKPRDIKR